MKKRSLSIILALVILCLIFFYSISTAGYSFNETKVLKKSMPFQSGKAVYQKEFGNDSIVIWNSSEVNFAKLVHKKWGMLYRVLISSQMLPSKPNDDISRTWSASLSSKDLYKTTFAFEVKNPAIEKIIISNENIDAEISKDLAEIKKISAVFIEVDVENGYAVSYNELPIEDTGNFVFRGLDKEGNIIAVGR